MPKAGLQMSQKPRKRRVRNQHNIQICANKSQNSPLEVFKLPVEEVLFTMFFQKFTLN